MTIFSISHPLRAILPVMALVLGAAAHGNPELQPPASAPTEQEARELAGFKAPLVQLGPGDTVSVQVYGQPDLSGTLTVSDDGNVPMALTGPVSVRGMSPTAAATAIERALRDGKYLVDPHVTVTVTDSHSQRVSVLGQIGKPGRYPIESNTSIFDLIAEAGGITEVGGDVVYILRPDAAGNITRIRLSLKGLSEGAKSEADSNLRGGDSVLVPTAPQVYVYGEVSTPGKFKVEPGMTVIQAIARAGGVTERGSQNRVVIKRRKTDGTYDTSKASLGDLVQPDDVIRVKESIF